MQKTQKKCKRKRKQITNKEKVSNFSEKNLIFFSRQRSSSIRWFCFWRHELQIRQRIKKWWRKEMWANFRRFCFYSRVSCCSCFWHLWKHKENWFWSELIKTFVPYFCCQKIKSKRKSKKILFPSAEIALYCCLKFHSEENRKKRVDREGRGKRVKDSDVNIEVPFFFKYSGRKKELFIYIK